MKRTLLFLTMYFLFAGMASAGNTGACTDNNQCPSGFQCSQYGYCKPNP